MVLSGVVNGFLLACVDRRFRFLRAEEEISCDLYACYGDYFFINGSFAFCLG